MTDGNNIPWRVQALERSMEKLDIKKADVKDVQALAEELKGVKKVLIWVAASFGTAAITFGVWALQLATHHG